jgi:hypothetical protein
MNIASLLVSVAALLAVIFVGLRTIRLGERSAKAAEDSAKSSERAVLATERAVEASVEASATSARSAKASESAATIAAMDARIRRVEGLMDVLLAMREVFNRQVEDHGGLGSPWNPEYGSREALDRLALMRTLETRLVLFDGDRFGPTTNIVQIPLTLLWRSDQLEFAIEEVKQELRIDARFRAGVMQGHTPGIG